MDATLARAEALNPRFDATCTWIADQARGHARKAEAAVKKERLRGSVHGIPITMKDVRFTKGAKTMAGGHIFANRMPDVLAARIAAF